ncbi:WD-REPEATS-REGION domain-containing protein [Mycena indigotica]|uniref:U three protein 7 n=1 Tax=Mycena indigotica TaxID=2126181 RepID=A0A8H6W5N6_9AGAR|nr:WD-REPEATS-REGION domain-containing protein [Mycena indigotica]KAF7303736.1 WD-REPEATS-REGION domain-containing protein [Mycena indigotica]
MDALIAKANERRKRRKINHQDKTADSIKHNSAIPRSLQDKTDHDQNGFRHITNPKLRKQLNRTSAQSTRAKHLAEDAELLLLEDTGLIQVEGELERTWRVAQAEIEVSAGGQAAQGRKEWKLDGGPYRFRYTRNGRHLAIVGNSGHAATFDWLTGTLHAELQLQETCRDITFLQDHSLFAIAQNKYVYVYDRDGVELHCLKSHIEPTRIEFLPYHWLLATIGNAGYLKYQDTSTGQLLVEHRTKLGACHAMTQNLHNAVIHLGHSNGCVTLWTPNLPHPAVQLLAHLGPVCSVAVDPSTGGRYMATAGRDSIVKVWDCRNWKGAVREWSSRGGPAEINWSERGSLAVASGGTVNVYASPTIQKPIHGNTQPPLYLTHPLPHRPLTSVAFAPFHDVLTVGHVDGLSSILIPGAGEPNFDSTEADPFENSKARREKEVKGLLDKLQPDMITLNPEFVGSLAPTHGTTLDSKRSQSVPFARLPRIERLRVQGKADETEVVDPDDFAPDGTKRTPEEKQRKKMRGKNKSLKRYLRKHRKNVIDPTTVAIRAKLEKQKQEKQQRASKGVNESSTRSALDRFITYPPFVPLAHPVPNYPTFIPEPPSTPGSPQGYQRFSSSPGPAPQQSQNYQPAPVPAYASHFQNSHQHGEMPPPPPMFAQPQFGAWGVNDATAQFGMQLGQSAVAAGQDYVQRTWGGVFPNTRVKPHFNVSNSYVIRKLRVLLFPWSHKQWGRKSHRTDAGQTEYLTPRDDLNSPDLYIPVMALVTYVLLSAFYSGVTARFQPQVLGESASRAIMVLILDFFVVLLGCYFLNVQSTSQSVDIVAYAGYKFVGVIAIILTGFLNLGRTLGWVTSVYFIAANSFFLLRSLGSIILPSAASRAASADPYATAPPPRQRRRRIGFLLFEAATQVVWMGFLARV